MTTPGFGIPVIGNYGNGGSSNGALPTIDHAIYAGSALTFGAPSLSGPARLPIIERITPRKINATKTIETTRSRVSVAVQTNGRMIGNRILAGSRAIALQVRSFQVR